MVDLLISRGFPPDRFFTIYNGIDFTPAPPQATGWSICAPWGWTRTRTAWWWESPPG
jgi:hypothetical protein